MSELFSRRQVVDGCYKIGALTLAGGAGIHSLTNGSAALANSREVQDPHFFLVLRLDAGMDAACGFDARPLSMTDAGIHHPYGGNPSVWQDGFGGATLVSEHFADLSSMKDDLTIVNGVLMAHTFDGHEQNSNFIFTGNPFGGKTFFNELNSQNPLGMIGEFGFGVQINNSENILPLTPILLQSLVKSFKQKGESTTGNDFASKFRQRRTEQILKQRDGLFRRGVSQLKISHSKSMALGKSISSIEQGTLPDEDEVGFDHYLEMAKEVLLKGLASTVVLSPSEIGQNFDLDFDTHDAQSAQEQPELFQTVAAWVSKTYKMLKETPGVGGIQSLWDQTTLMITSEFSRTMRQEAMPIDATGTDHNPLGNSIVFGGKGIRGGRIFGASDLSSVTERPSRAHLTLDGRALKVMGRPIDHQTGLPMMVSPEEFKLEHYLSYQQIGVGLMRMFGLAEQDYWEVSRGVKAKPFLPLFL